MRTFRYLLTAGILFIVQTALAQPAINNGKTAAERMAQESKQKGNPFLIHTGKIIRTVRIKRIEFGTEISDTLVHRSGFTTKMANALHADTRVKVIRNNLLFSEGEHLNPWLMADNERHLRDQEFIQDALILVEKQNASGDSVDVVVMVKDVFSIGIGLGIGGTQKFRFELKEENLTGTGTKIAASTLVDSKRNPNWGFGAELVRRNIRGSFVNWTLGFRNYANAFNSNRNEETYVYTRFEKPLASQFLRWMGSFEAAYNKTNNYYLPDTSYFNDYRYSFYQLDGWAAYNFGVGRLRYDKAPRSGVRKFLAVRAFHQQFLDVPNRSLRAFDATYTDATGLLASFSLYKQNFYRASYVYGFGRNEDIPQGFNVSLVGGYVMREDSLYNDSRLRPYFGAETQFARYNKKGFYSFYTLRAGGYRYKSRWEDFDVLLNIDHFTRLKKTAPNWYRRFFFGGGIAKQFVPVLEPALLLRSQYGLPYFDFGEIAADMRTTFKSEMVFYHTRRFYGFGIAPFVFADASLLKPTREAFSKSDLYSAVGGGFRLRNENFLLGTMEFRMSYFPRVLADMNHFKIKINTKLRYKFNASFIRRPDVVAPN